MTEPNKMADLVGPFHDKAAVAGLLGCRVGDLTERALSGELLAVTTSDGVPVYPAFQFTPDGTPRSELAPILQAFARCDPWTTAVWLRTHHDDLNGTTPDEWLAAGGDPETVRALARRRAFELSA